MQFVLGGGSYEEIAQWRDTLMNHVRENNPRLMALESNYNETSRTAVEIDYERAASLGVTVTEIGRTLEVLLGGPIAQIVEREVVEHDRVDPGREHGLDLVDPVDLDLDVGRVREGFPRLPQRLGEVAAGDDGEVVVLRHDGVGQREAMVMAPEQYIRVLRSVTYANGNTETNRRRNLFGNSQEGTHAQEEGQRHVLNKHRGNKKTQIMFHITRPPWAGCFPSF